MDEIKYHIWMRETAGISAVKANRLLEHFTTPSAVFFASKEQQSHVTDISSGELDRLQDKSLRQAEQIIAKCAALHVDILTIDMPAYPQRLANIFDPPTVLYVRGRLPDFNTLPSMAVVGQRKATPYGLIAAEKMGYCLSVAGFIVVSGMAEGIDSASHRGALKGGTPTVAVFGTAIDKCFPAFNVGLMRQIIAEGAVISEYPPDAAYNKSSFPRRNRIISGLCLGTVVAEAPLKSGSLITATMALEEGRDVFALPGDVGSACSEGTNKLIRDGCARLVTSPEQVIEEYEGLYRLERANPVSYSRQTPPPPIKVAQGTVAYETERPRAELSPMEEQVLSAVAKRAHIDEIVQRTGLPIGAVLTALTMLEIKKQVVQTAGKHYESAK